MPTATDLGLSAHQYRNLFGCIAAVQSRPETRGHVKAAYMIVCACLAESGMQMYANRNVPGSFSGKYEWVKLTWSADGLGSDHASIGMLQQQVGPSETRPVNSDWMNQSTVADGRWGTVAQLMDPQYSANKFLEVLEQQTWQTDTLPWLTIQNVQGSAFPDGSNYKAQWARAQQLVNAVWGQHPDTQPAKPLDQEEDDMILILNAGNGGRSGFFLSGGKALISISSASRHAHIAAGGKVENWPAAEFVRALQVWK